MGNKQRIVGDILPIMLSTNTNVFVDVFCGSCSVVQQVPKEYFRIANDKNKYLIAMWKSLVEGKEMPTTIERHFYSDVRDSFNKKDGRYTDDIIGWVGYMASFNGRFFDGGYSGHNVVGTNGRSRDYITENIKNTLQQVDMLKGVVWESKDYFDLNIPDNSLVYADPPYKNTKQYQFSRDFSHERFYNWCREISSKGHTVFVSEYWMPDDFECVWEKEVTNAMNQTITKKPVERLFTIKNK